MRRLRGSRRLVLAGLMLAWGISAASAQESGDSGRDVAVVSLGHDGGFACSGVLVGPQHVITAAHCLPTTRVRFGPAWSEGAEDERQVVRAVAHPDRRMDAALLILDGLAPVDPAPLLATSTPSATVRIVGFGTQSQGRTRDRGGHRVARTVSPGSVQCNGRRSAFSGCIAGREWVVSGLGGRDTCGGDSGGALFSLEPSGPALAAIVSRGVLNGRHVCGDGGVYVRVGALITWLDQYLGGNP